MQITTFGEYHHPAAAQQDQGIEKKQERNLHGWYIHRHPGVHISNRQRKEQHRQAEQQDEQHQVFWVKKKLVLLLRLILFHFLNRY